jgi:lipid II:glycine glycyltransferase (peptidoglycan interpeptide bridge formation enzyme)
MTEEAPRTRSAAPSGGDAANWDATVKELGGTLMQSWAWGELERRYNRAWVERLELDGRHGDALAQLTFRRRGPIVMAELLYGPLFSHASATVELFDRIDRTCKRRQALSLRIEPQVPLPLDMIQGPPFVVPSRPRPTMRTLVIPLLDDDELLGQMRKQTRRYVRLGQRRGVSVEVLERPEASEPGLAAFYHLLTETAERNAFRIRPFGYYADALRFLGDDAALLLATHDGVPAAAEIVIRFGADAGSLWAASSTTHREYGTAAYLLFEAMRWARDRGSTRYDLWGLPPDPDSLPDSGAPASKGSQQAGIYHFKVGFGGAIIDFPPAVERHYRPLMMRGLSRLQGRGLLRPLR